jgi:S-methylmethionine-dependent homocysteine/selenocysteine methylase
LKNTGFQCGFSGLLERLNDGEYVIVGEGYLFEFERRGYLSAGPYTPEVVLEHPHLVKKLHEEFVHAGSDVVLAFTVGTLSTV